MSTINIGEKVLTVHGEGTITGIDLPESRVPRAIVELNKNPFSFTPAYFPDEFCSIDTPLDNWPEKVAVGIATIGATEFVRHKECSSYDELYETVETYLQDNSFCFPASKLITSVIVALNKIRKANTKTRG